jgi:predicted acylesterase/phospholipase RssA
VTDFCWLLDSGGAGRGAWQGGVIYRFMEWARASERLPLVTMGASAGGYAAADVATGTERTVLKGWTAWGRATTPRDGGAGRRSGGWPGDGLGNFRTHLHTSVRYVMADAEVAGIFDRAASKKLLVFTTRVRRRDHRRFGAADMLRYFLKSATRKLPRPLKYLPARYLEELVIFATNLPEGLRSEHVRPLTPDNLHAVIETSCVVPVAMGAPIPASLIDAGAPMPGDAGAVLMDGGFATKMPMALFEEDARYHAVARWASADRTIVFCCDPGGSLWENSSRLRRLNGHPGVRKALDERRLLVVHPDHPIEAGFLCTDNDVIMRTFHRGQDQGDRLLRSPAVQRFLEHA